MASNGRPTRIVVVDDSEVVRMKLCTLFTTHESAGDFELVGEAASAPEGLRLSAEQQPDVVVMDLKMPGMSGIEATWKLGSVAPSSRVLVLTVSEEQEDVADAVMAGAEGYLVKGAPDDEVIEAVRKVAAGERAISSQVAEELVKRDRFHPTTNPVAGVRSLPASDAVRTSLRPRHLLQTMALAVVVGLLLTGINQGHAIADGSADTETWVKAALNVLVVFGVANVGLLAGRASGRL